MSLDFSTDTALTPMGDGRFEATIDRRWWIVIGPNGGLIAAMLLRAAMATIDRPEFHPRILTIRYLSAATEGRVSIETVIDRAGRRVVYATTTMTQDGRVIAVASITAATDQTNAYDVADRFFPEVAEAGETAITPPAKDDRNSRFRWERRPLFHGEPLAGGGPGSGGWLRLEPPSPIDHAVVAAMVDNWPPSLRDRLDSPLVHTITLELTVYFRTGVIELDPSDHCLVILRSESAIDGFHEEAGEVWSPDGTLLVTSRQLALVFERDE